MHFKSPNLMCFLSIAKVKTITYSWIYLIYEQLCFYCIIWHSGNMQFGVIHKWESWPYLLCSSISSFLEQNIIKSVREGSWISTPVPMSLRHLSWQKAEWSGLKPFLCHTTTELFWKNLFTLWTTISICIQEDNDGMFLEVFLLKLSKIEQ